MKSKKKITIKPFLNTNLASVGFSSEGRPLYPLYIQVTYDRRNTQFKSTYGKYYADINDPELNNLKNFEIAVLEKIIRYEVERTNDNLNLLGLKTRYDVYGYSLKYSIDDYLKSKLQKLIKKTDSELMFVLKFDGFKCNFDNLYKASKLLFKNLKNLMDPALAREIEAYEYFKDFEPIRYDEYNFPTIIDWVNGSYKSAMEQKLGKLLKNKKQVAEIINLLDNIIREKIDKPEFAQLFD